MNPYFRIQIAVLLLYSSSIVGAPMHKCTDADGKTYYQDSACPIGSNVEQLTTEPPRANTSAYDLKKPDQACIQAVKLEADRCATVMKNNMNSIQQCVRERLSPNCVKLYDSGYKMPMDAVCQQELGQAAKPCGEKLLALQKQCLRERLSQDCINQLNAHDKGHQEALNTCVSKMQEIGKLCSTEKGEDYFRCQQQHKAELEAEPACRALESTKNKIKEIKGPN